LSGLKIETAEVFDPLLAPSRYKGAYGGRGSGKSHFFAELMVEAHILDQSPENRSVCIREVQKTLAESSKKLIEDKIAALGVGGLFDVQRDRIVAPGGGLIMFTGMTDHNAESIKSLEGARRAWIEEAQTLSERSLELLRPTIRADGSEIWASWNPTRKKDAIDVFLRQDPPANAAVVEANWRDNPWFPQVLEEERLLELARYPDRYDHVWEGGYVRVLEGAYFAKGLAEARAQGRIGKLAQDPLLPVRAYWDLGGAGAKADAMAIWLVQFVAREIRVLDYIEGQGQVLAYYVNELRARGWDKARCILPHDGVRTNDITGKRLEDHLGEAGFDTRTIPNQGPGAAKARIEAVRRLLPRVWFNEGPTEAGREALGWYHEKRDPKRNLGLGPNHDWSSHGADAFGLMAIDHKDPRKAASAPTNDLGYIR
jgi:phage terminase large subunit